MKNEYQEALHQIKYCFEQGSNEFLKESLDDLQELVDKETPIKPKEKFDYDYGDLTYCGKCDEDISFGWSFCPNCGQRIDWSDEE